MIEFIGPGVSICIFVGGAFFWLLRRMDRQHRECLEKHEKKRLEDKASFVSLFERARMADARISYVLGRANIKIEDLPEGLT